MRIFRLCSLVVVFSLGLSFLVGAGLQEAAPKPPQKEEAKSLIRMDLLRLSKTETGLPKRNIFAPRSPSSPFPPLQPQDDLGLNEAATPPSKEQERPTFNVNLRYIGYIESSGRMIALVILEGQTLAVAEGEVISEGIRIGKISRAEIEVILPDSTTRKFSLEGE